MEGGVTVYDYDKDHRLIFMTAAEGYTVSYEYDGMGNLTQTKLHRVDALGNVTAYTYDGNGNLVSKTDADGYTTEYTYNGVDLVTNISYNGAKEVSYRYNATGDLVSMTDWLGTSTFELDLLHRITAATDHKGNRVEYDYDGMGNQTEIRYPDGTAAQYAYDLVQNQTQVTETDGSVTEYDYDGMARVTELRYPNGWVEYYTYDVMGRLLAVDDTHPSEKPAKTQKHTYRYDANGNLLYEYMRGNGTGQAKNETLYTYDALNRLTTAHDNYGSSTRVYTYDSLGNLTLETGLGSHECDYIYNNLNQQVDRSSDGWMSHTVSTYDGRGNLVLEQYGKNKKLTRAGQYVYDETDKLVRGVNGNGEESVYTYNGLGALMENTWIIAKNGYGYHDVDAGDLAPDLPDLPNPGNNGNGNSGNNGNSGDNGNHFGSENGDNGNHFGNSDDVTGDGLMALSGDPNEGIMLLGNSGNGNNGNNGNGNGNQDKPTGSDVKKTSTVVKQFVVDFTAETYRPLMEHEVNGLDYRYVYSDKARLSVVVQGIEHGSAAVLDEHGELHAYYHADYLGTTDYLTSAVDSRVIAWTSYDEWGEINHNAVLKCGQRELDLVKEYATHDFDAVLNMYYAKARFYDADNRHFASMDPILEPSVYDLKVYVTDPMQLVQYLYVKNNAVNWIDPTGLIVLKEGDYFPGGKDHGAYRYANELEKLQSWLEALHYGDKNNDEKWTISPKGKNLGGVTVAAVQSFQLNHRMDITTTVDNDTYLAIANEYVLETFASRREQQFEYARIVASLKKADLREGLDTTYYRPFSCVMVRSVDPAVISASGADGVIMQHGKYYLDYTSAITALLDNSEDEFFLRGYLRNSLYKEKYPDRTPLDWIDEYTQNITPESDLVWFYKQMAAGMPWDVKLKRNWDGRFEDARVHATYYSQKFLFAYNGDLIHAENLGNITYGYFGLAMGYDKKFLKWAGGTPNILSNPQNVFKPYFGEDDDDIYYVNWGMEIFENKYPHL